MFLLPDIEETGIKTGEVTIMIAEPLARRKGFGQETMMLMMNYCIESLKIRKFVALIGEKNSASVKLFEKLGFSEVEKTYFGEWKYEKVVIESDWEHFKASTGLVYQETFYQRQSDSKR